MPGIGIAGLTAAGNGGDNVYKWLVIFRNAEFEVQAPDILQARRAVEHARGKYGLARRATYELYRLSEV